MLSGRFWQRRKYSGLPTKARPCRKASAIAEPGWKSAVKVGACITALCFIVNAAVLIWVHARQQPQCPTAPDDEMRTLACGSCDRMQLIKTLSHVAINVASTLILATSTTCMQVLSAPTRAEVDAAHRKGMWMDIGLLSFQNLGKIDRKRVLLYLALLITGGPIHFLYNSVILSTQGVYDSLAILATPQFIANSSVDDGAILSVMDKTESRAGLVFDLLAGVSQDNPNYTHVWKYPKAYLPEEEEVFSVIDSFKSNSSSRNSSAADCLKLFEARVTQMPNVLIVTSSTQSSQIIDIMGTAALQNPPWACVSPDRMFNSSADFMYSCDITSWLLSSEAKVFAPELPSELGQPINRPLPVGFWTMDYCIVQDGSNFQERCSVIFSTTLISVVMFVNAVKLAVITYTVGYLNFSPLVTVGDAIVSFLRNPDSHTVGLAVHSDASIKASFRAETTRILSARVAGHHDLTKILFREDRHEMTMHPALPAVQSRRWARAASLGRWGWTTFFFWCLYIPAITFFVIGLGSNALSFKGWNDSSSAPTIIYNMPDSLLSQVMLTNLPQFLVSCFYVAFMGLITTMLVASELCDFTQKAKAMRVTPSRSGQQRSSYFLQVPYRYSLPVLIAMIFLHWLISQAFFIIRIVGFDVLGNVGNPDLVHDLGYSLPALFLIVIWGAVIFLFPVLLGFRRLPAGLPLMNNNSLAISIACHPLPDEPKDGHEKSLKYGLVRSTDPNTFPSKRIGFSASEVERLTGKEELISPRCLSALMYPDIENIEDCSLNTPLKTLHSSLRKRL